MSNRITLDMLRFVMTSLSPEKCNLYLPIMNDAMLEFDITTRLRAAAFLGQLAHESVELKYFEEIASGQAYEGRRDLGNTQKGDGRRYKGRGPIQLTGRANYRRTGEALNLPLEEHPELAAVPVNGFRIAGLYWQMHNLNALADREDYKEITRRINGGLNGWPSRLRYYQRALSAIPENFNMRDSSSPQPSTSARVLKRTEPPMSGEDVRHAQQALCDKGYLDIAGVDDKYGPMTESAITCFQRDHGLESDGKVGPRTREKLLGR